MKPRSKRASRPPIVLTPDALAELFDVGRGAGLDLVGACRAQAWTQTRSQLEVRKAESLNSSMAFTYKNPARSTEPSRVMKGAASLIVGARSYASAPPEGGQDDAVVAGELDRAEVSVARYAATDHYSALAASLEAVAQALRDRGARAVVVLDRNDIVDREAAWRAGIGWYGKNSLLLAPGHGSWIVLGSVVTDAVLFDHVPRPVSEHCGPCRRCIDACPTDAIVAEGVIDAGRCLSWLLQAPGPFPVEFREALGDRIYGCDDCQAVCPPSRASDLRIGRLAERDTPNESPPRLDAIELLNLDDDELLDRCGRWYIAGRDPNIVRRNLLINLGNVADPTSDVVRSVLTRYAASGDALLAEHATWAQRRLGHTGDPGQARRQ